MKILIVGPAWVGDMVMAQSLLMRLQELNPGATIDVLAPAWTRDLLLRMPQVSRVLEMPLGHGELKLGLRWQLGQALKKEQYQQAIVLPNSLKSALIPCFAGIPRRTGWLGECRYGLLNDVRRLDKRKYPLMVQRFVALAHPAVYGQVTDYPRPALQSDPRGREALQERFSLNTHKPVLVLCPGAEFGPSKQWPVAYFAALARQALGQGQQVWIMGSANDQADAAEIRMSEGLADSTDVHDFCGQTTLAQAIDLLSMADAVVSNDSGLMHVAAALDRPLVVLYGSTSPAFTPPLAQQVRVLSMQLDCSPCFKRECPLQHHRCMQDLQPERVMQALQEMASATHTHQ